MNDDIRTRTLAELAEIEAAVFRFGHQARAFMDAFPEGLPEPHSVVPKYTDGYDSAHEPIVGGGSYLHLTVRTPAEVDEWAAWLQETAVHEPAQADLSGVHYSAFSRVTGTVDGLRVYVGCMVMHTRQQRLQETGSAQGGTA